MSHPNTSNVQASLTADFQSLPAPRSDFDAALLDILNLEPHSGDGRKRDGRRKLMRDILGSDVPWYTIRDWRRGRRQAPQWARDKVRAKLLARVAAIEHRLAVMHRIPVQQVKIRDLSR